jgi:hypothetical protein
MSFNEELHRVILDVLYDEWRCGDDLCLATDLTKRISYHFDVTKREVSNEL